MEKCKNINPKTGHQCVREEGHVGFHCIGNWDNPVEKWVVKCKGECLWAYYDRADKFEECVLCGDRRDNDDGPMSAYPNFKLTDLPKLEAKYEVEKEE